MQGGDLGFGEGFLLGQISCELCFNMRVCFRTISEKLSILHAKSMIIGSDTLMIEDFLEFGCDLPKLGALEEESLFKLKHPSLISSI
jgi:hypothetical protein